MNDICRKIENEENFSKTEISKKWIQHREKTFAIILLHMFSMGLEYTMLHTTLWPYITNGMHSSHSNLFYGLICAGRVVIPISLGLLISKWFDIHRRLKLCSNVGNMANAVGHILYIIPLSPFFAFAGMILQGSSFILRFIMNSEILRVYENDEIQSRFLVTYLVYGFGEVVGTLCVILLEKLNFWIGGLHIMYGNMPSMILLTVTIIRLILTYFFIHDISKEFDLKEHNFLSMQSVRLETAFTNRSHKPGTYFSIDTIVLLLQQFFSACISTTLCPRVIPLIIETFHYGQVVVQMSFLGASVMIMTTSLTIRQMKPTSTGVYYCGIMNLLLMTVAMVILLIITTQKTNDVVNYILLILLIICFSTSWICEATFVMVTLGKMCHASKQSAAENARMLAKLSGVLIGALISAYVYENFIYCFPLLISIGPLLLIGVIARRKTLSDPKIMDNNNWR